MGSKWDPHIDQLRSGACVRVNVLEFGYANTANAWIAFKSIAKRRGVHFERLPANSPVLAIGPIR